MLHMVWVALVQAYRLKIGLQLFGQEQKNTVQKKIQQHHDMQTYCPIDPAKLTYEEKGEQ